MKLLFVLSEIENQNKKADEIGVKVEVPKKEETAEKLQYYWGKDGSKQFDESKDGSRRFDESKDGSKRFDESKDGSRRFDDTKEGKLRIEREARELDAKIHGPVVDVIELINNIGKK